MIYDPWKDVHDCLPEDNQLVLVALDYRGQEKFSSHYCVHLAYFYRNSGWDLPYWDGIVDVSYWMEIPVPSKKEVFATDSETKT